MVSVDPNLNAKYRPPRNSKLRSLPTREPDVLAKDIMGPLATAADVTSFSSTRNKTPKIAPKIKTPA